MKDNLTHIPQVDLKDVKHFWVLGSQYRDGILGEYNLKTDLKAALYPSKDSSILGAAELN